MLGRIFGMLLGLALGGVAYAILNPGGLEGRIPPIPLGAFESLRFYVAMAAAGLGAIIFIAALLPKGPGGPSGGGGKKRRKGGPPVTIDFNDPAPMTAHDHGSTHAHHAAEVVAEAPAVAEVAPEPEVHAGAPPGAPGAFAEARRELHEHTRAERWSEAADNVRRLSSLAGDEHERRLAAQDAGDFARAQGLTDQAADAYGEALTYARQIGEPAGLADALTNIGDVAYEEQRLDTAVDAYEEALALRRAFAEAQPADVAAKRALSLALERLADAREDRGHRMRALDLYRESLDISGSLAAADPVAYGEDLAVTRRRLAELEAKVAV
ncbi:tetratricopeptide repeat protein [Phenylobacterium sp.]|uniref:tetratricopeptide repeat protein n=1 Tax=Phenylobacterium sp. TaxID=1871053 RepID=UPI0027265DED|nr:tetratricopeptide repeat protein [Phenylobacterium sp.]MDO8323670.1 tetratricopeptide repeat protein [Phenylobacterium sp.]MDP3633338.1 tetratricopeptide repeat protein [Phenylobacterium sp.]